MVAEETCEKLLLLGPKVRNIGGRSIDDDFLTLHRFIPRCLGTKELRWHFTLRNELLRDAEVARSGTSTLRLARIVVESQKINLQKPIRCTVVAVGLIKEYIRFNHYLYPYVMG